MEDVPRVVEAHYGRGGILDSILRVLHDMGSGTLHALAPRDLAPVDEFHVGGRDATIELADRAALKPGTRVLDVGCGLGGSVRYLAAERQCRATGIDLTAEYIEAANALSRLLRLQEVTAFQRSNALDLPFPDESFDVVWTEAAQMNIADKRRFYSEMARLLPPGGRLAFHDIFQGDGGDLYYPVPWADDPSISFLARPQEVRQILNELQLDVLHWQDKSRQCMDWLAAAVERSKSAGPARLGLHLLMGDGTKPKLENNIRNLAEGRFVVIQAVAEKA